MIDITGKKWPSPVDPRGLASLLPIKKGAPFIEAPISL